jgi:hypothetical protein
LKFSNKHECGAWIPFTEKSIEILGAYANQMLKAEFFFIFSGKESTFMEAAGLPVRVEFFTGLPI